jgi:glyoxylase-like metal-dependent hydrolase (beta-lactamase superfamily II)
MSKLSRRDLLKGFGVSAAGLGYGLTFGFSNLAAQSDQVVTAYFQFNVGDYTVTVVSDGRFGLDTSILGTNAEEGAVDALLAENFLPTGTLPNAIQFLLVNTGDNLVLLDTGRGANGAGMAALNALGVTPEDIGTVVISHMHGDHIGGLVTDGVANFPNAPVLFPQPEWDFLQENSSNENLQGTLGTLQVLADSDQLSFYAAEDEVVSGIQAISTPGHTPGHMSLLISSGGDTLLNLVDSVLNNVTAVQRPDWHIRFDSIPEMAVETRHSILGRAASEQLHVFGYHFSVPGLGFIVPAEENWRFVPGAF